MTIFVIKRGPNGEDIKTEAEWCEDCGACLKPVGSHCARCEKENQPDSHLNDRAWSVITSVLAVMVLLGWLIYFAALGGELTGGK